MKKRICDLRDDEHFIADGMEYVAIPVYTAEGRCPRIKEFEQAWQEAVQKDVRRRIEERRRVQKERRRRLW